MEKAGVPSAMIGLLNQANAREMQVSIQYMLQHSIWFASDANRKPMDRRMKFISSHTAFWLPGVSLRKIAMAEMNHAEMIAERIVQLGGELLPQHDPVTVGKTTKEMMAVDLKEEQGAIDLYEKIIKLARETDDKVTLDMFIKILADEKKHHTLFSDMLQV